MEKENKLEVILQCAMEEFSKKPYDKVSIFQIAKMVGMSRTSFYFYFKNKEELYLALMKQFKDMFLQKYPCREPDFFEHLKNIFLFLTDFKNTPYQPFVENCFENVNPRLGRSIAKVLEEKKQEPSFFEYFSKIFPADKLNIIFIMLFSVIYTRLLAYYQNNISKQQALSQYEQAIELLQHGILRSKQ